MIFVAMIFLLVYFWDRKFREVIIYMVAILIGFLPRMVLDYSLFHMPIYSLIRFFGTNMMMSLGSGKVMAVISLFDIDALLILVAISPLLFMIYKIRFKENKRDWIFILLTVVLFFVRVVKLKYFVILAPLLIIFLAKELNGKQIKWHCLLSLIVIVGLTFNFFVYAEDSRVQNDLNRIVSEFSDAGQVIAGPYEANYFASLLWKDNPRISWFEDFQASRENKTKLKGYTFEFNSKIRLRDRLVISADFVRFDNRTYENYIVIAKQGDKMNEMGFKTEKCYEVLCVYR
jgi:hypothetical protein